MKRTKLTLAVLVVVLALLLCLPLLSGCSVNKESLTVLALDAYGNPLEGASVSLLGQSAKAVKTKQNGTVTISSGKAGTYLVLIEKDGYAAQYGVASFGKEGSALDLLFISEYSNDPFYGLSKASSTGSATLRIALPKTGVSVTGNATYFDNDGVTHNMANTEIELYITGTSFVKKYYTTSTNANGEYKFDNLPENTAYSVAARECVVGDYKYAPDTPVTGTTKKVGEPTASPLETRLNFRIKYDPFIITSSINLKIASKTSPIVITFSSPVDTDLVLNDSLTVYNNSSVIYVKKAWSNGNKTLTVTPISGEWPTSPMTVYLSGLKSSDGKSLASSSGNILTVSVIGNEAESRFAPDVKNLRHNIVDGKLTVSFDMSDEQYKAFYETLLTYKVYYKYSDENKFNSANISSYSLSYENGTATATLSFISVSRTPIKFFILANEDGKSSSLDTAAVITVTE